MGLKGANLAKTIAFKSIGCRTNQEEVASLSFRLAEQGHRIVDKIDEAEIIIVNTCSVTSRTEAKTKRLLNQLSRCAPHSKVCVTGCLAQQEAHELKRRFGARWIVGNTRKNDIPSIIQDERGGIFWGPCEKNPGKSPGAPLPVVQSPKYYDVSRHTRYSIKIQEGCNYQCAYCIVPVLRGPSRSAPPAGVVSACRAAVDAGFKEIVLTGTHIGHYGGGPGENLLALLENLLTLPGDFRIRLSSLDPRDLSEPLLALLESHPKVCRHLHVSVQSLSAQVLRRMGRPGNYFNTLVERLSDFRTAHTDAGIGGDFIVGFPGETNDMFEETIANIERIGFSYGHVFRYSKRPSTAAAAFDGQVGDPEKNWRGERMGAVLDKCRSAFINDLVGRPQRIIVETERPVTGMSSNYVRMEAPGARARRNSWLIVTTTGVNPLNNRCVAVPGKDVLNE
jgi:threonylcarbamoyladenosine tRNA methylthiotransferase MtaB